MPFVVPRERDRGEMQGPEAVVEFFEGDVVPGERRRDNRGALVHETQPLLLTKRTSICPG